MEKSKNARTGQPVSKLSTVCWRRQLLAVELVKQGLSDRNGMIAFGRIRERFGKTAGVAKLSDVFLFQWTSSDSLEDKWLRWLKLMRQGNMTSLGDDARETLTTAGLERAKERSPEQHLRLRAPQTWTNESCILCGKRGHLSQVCRSSGGNPSAGAVEAEHAEP